MEVDALMANALKSVKKLVFKNTKLKTFNRGLFNGLESLEILNIQDAASSVQVIEKGVLDVLNETLKEFTLEESVPDDFNRILIGGFTGSEALPKLTNVKHMNNLGSSITSKSFVGLQNVRTLDLSKCQIDTIG